MFARALSVMLLSSAFLACGDDDNVPPTTFSDATVRSDAAARDATATPEDAGTANDDATTGMADSGTAQPDAQPIFPDAAQTFPDAAETFPDAATVSPDAGQAGPSFSQIFTQVIQPSCSCHTLGADGRLSMPNEAAAYAALMGRNGTGGVSSAGCPTVDRVVPGDAAQSHFHQKLAGTQPRGCGSQMPLKARPLPCAQQNLVRDWINAGALR